MTRYVFLQLLISNLPVRWRGITYQIGFPETSRDISHGLDIILFGSCIFIISLFMQQIVGVFLFRKLKKDWDFSGSFLAKTPL